MRKLLIALVLCAGCSASVTERDKAFRIEQQVTVKAELIETGESTILTLHKGTVIRTKAVKTGNVIEKKEKCQCLKP